MNDVPAVEFRNVSKVFPDGTTAVNDIAFQVLPGRTLALLGPSGCGKTTTLRLINRLEDASAGEVLVRGRDVRSQRPEELRRSIGYVIQEGGLFPHLKVSANVATVPRLLGWTRSRIRAAWRKCSTWSACPSPSLADGRGGAVRRPAPARRRGAGARRGSGSASHG